MKITYLKTLMGVSACFVLNCNLLGVEIPVTLSQAGCKSQPLLPIPSSFCEIGSSPNWTRSAVVVVGDYVETSAPTFSFAQSSDVQANCSKTATVTAKTKASQKYTQQREWEFKGEAGFPLPVKAAVDAKFGARYANIISGEQTFEKEVSVTVPNCTAEYLWAAVKWQKGEKGTIRAFYSCRYILSSDSGTCKKGMPVAYSESSEIWEGKYDSLTQHSMGVNSGDDKACDCECKTQTAGSPPSPPAWWPQKW